MSKRDAPDPSSWRRATDRRPLVLGHRGERGRAPENTLAGFDLAMDDGADGIELDVRLCGSGEVVVCHDSTLERVSTGRDRRVVEDLPLRQLQEVDVGDGQRVPTLEGVLDWAARRAARVNVEVKSDVRNLGLLVRRVSELVGRAPQAEERIILSSFDVRAVYGLSRRVTGIAVGWLVHRGQRVLRSARGWSWIGAQGVHAEHVLVTPSAIRRWKRGGALVNTWTVNDVDAAVRLSALGVDAIISDDPGKILRGIG